MMNKNSYTLPLNLFLFGLLTFCSQNNDVANAPTHENHTPPAAETTDAAAPTTDAATADAATEEKKYDQVFKMDLEKINNETHWAPKDFVVKPGTTVLFEINHNMEGGFDFHGFAIPALNIATQVNRGQLAKVEVAIPADFPEGEYNIDCHFHPAHKGSKLIVKK